jgi:5'-deoxynucleotidase YfbR-like HD superfamily hydrolase
VGKSFKEKIHDVEEKIVEEVEFASKRTSHGIKDEYKDLQKIEHNNELIYYKSDALAIVIRKLGGFDDFLKVVDGLTREGYWMINSEDIKNLLSNFGIALPGTAKGTLYYFQNKKYIN